MTPTGRPDGRPRHDGGHLAWGSCWRWPTGWWWRGWQPFHLNRTRRDPACYQVYVLDRRGATVWPAHWIDTYADWAQLRDVALPTP